jgi:hypothetical protein
MRAEPSFGARQPVEGRGAQMDLIEHHGRRGDVVVAFRGPVGSLAMDLPAVGLACY